MDITIIDRGGGGGGGWGGGGNTTVDDVGVAVVVVVHVFLPPTIPLAPGGMHGPVVGRLGRRCYCCCRFRRLCRRRHRRGWASGSGRGGVVVRRRC